MKAFLMNYFSKRLGKTPRINPLQFYRADFVKPFSIIAHSKNFEPENLRLLDSRTPDREGWLDIYGHSAKIGDVEKIDQSFPYPDDVDLCSVLVFLDKADNEGDKVLDKQPDVLHPMSVDDIMDMFNENYDDLEKKIGTEKIAEIKPEVAAAKLLGKNIRFGTCAAALYSKKHGKYLLQELANRLGVYIMGATHNTYVKEKQFSPNPDKQKGHLYVAPYFGDWVLFKPGGDPFADKPYRVLGYRDSANQQVTKSGMVVNIAYSEPVQPELWLNVCTDHAEELIAQDQEEEKKAKMNKIVSSFGGLFESDYVVTPDPDNMEIKVVADPDDDNMPETDEKSAAKETPKEKDQPTKNTDK